MGNRLKGRMGAENPFLCYSGTDRSSMLSAKWRSNCGALLSEKLLIVFGQIRYQVFRRCGGFDVAGPFQIEIAFSVHIG